MSPLARLLAFYLPQFHPIPENDEWWGKGFTEWTNTARAVPLFRGHYQPHIPADLGFYDLRVPETREAQAELARAYGIEGFCYYHYWFGGKRLLQRPLEEVIATGRPDFPFCVCWANQTWSGIWHGAPDHVLVEQTYPGDDDHRVHFEYLLPAFTDRRYIAVDGMPVFVIYRPLAIPGLRRVTDLWRQMAIDAGLPGLHLIGVHEDPHWDPTHHGLDAATCQRLPERRGWISKRYPLRWGRQRLDELRGRPTVYRYEDALADLLPCQVTGFDSYPMVTHAWDNSPRSGVHALVLHESEPELFRRVLQRALTVRAGVSLARNLVFLKSWNEWAEGNHLEPDLKFGHGYLQVIREECTRSP